MDRQQLEFPPLRVQVARQLDPKPTYRREEEELGYEELEERLAPGGTLRATVNKTAGWGC